MTRSAVIQFQSVVSLHLPGVLASIVVAIAARFLADQYHAPVMLLALLLGMSMNFLAAGPSKPGIDFSAREILRVGVALLGLRISLEQIVALGWHPVLIVVVSVVVTILVSMLAARALGFNALFGLLSGGATAICGASAALALAAALPAHQAKERATLFTVIGVSSLSTLAMIVYPVIARALGLDPLQTGVFLGATIHDVAQVVGAGYSMSHDIGDTATVVKLMRIAMLLPVILIAVLITRSQGRVGTGERPPLLPWFAVAFIAFATVTSFGWVPSAVQNLGNQMSSWCLVVAISALGMKIQLKELASVGFKPILLMVGETVFLLGLVLLLIRLGS
jgi:uncharacterized integral membrane protein (TIGR00698 family)